MKKRFGLLVGLLASALALCLVLVGCGGTASDPKKDFVGVWEMYSFVDENGTEDTETIEFMKALDMNCYIVLCDDGSAALDMYGEVATGTWEAKDSSTVTISASDDLGTADVQLKDGKLSMPSSDGSILFEKTDQTVPASASDYESPMTSISADAGTAAATEPTEINQVVVDDENCTILVVDRRTDDWGDPGYDLVITNKLDKTISVTSADSWSVNGTEAEPSIWEDVPAGESAEVFMWFEGSVVGDDSNLVNVTGQFHVLDEETYDDIAFYDVSL